MDHITNRNIKKTIARYLEQPPAMTLQVFTHNIGNRDVTLNAVMVNETPWFRGNDVASALGYTNPHQALLAHVDDDDRAKLGDLGPLANRGPLNHNDRLQTFVSESGLYSLIMRSQKDEAKVIKRWITKDVLPSIRKTGQYTSPTEPNVVSKNARSLK